MTSDPDPLPTGVIPDRQRLVCPLSGSSLALLSVLLTELEESTLPVDRLLDQCFRQHRHLGSTERRAIGEWCYLLLRHRRRLSVGVAESGHPTDSLAQLAQILATQRPAWPDATSLLATLPVPGDHGAVDHSFPDWLWQRLVDDWSAAEVPLLAAALNRPAPVDLRVNTLRTDRERVLAALHQEGITAVPTPWSPVGVRLEGRVPLGALSCYRQGWVEIQDEGSQLLVPILAPQPGETVVDLCAGAGGKTLHAAVMMNNRGRLIAADNDPRRLQGLVPRARRAKADLIRPMPIRHERDPGLSPLVGKVDKVLVDAPCSSLGTLRRRPEIKWRLTEELLVVHHQRQTALLAAGAVLLRPRGRLLYTTCSLLHQENSAAVHSFLVDHPHFMVLSIQRVRSEPVYAGADPFLWLLPHRHGTDGFFAALLERRR